jgi:hypothetical protein
MLAGSRDSPTSGVAALPFIDSRMPSGTRASYSG